MRYLILFILIVVMDGNILAEGLEFQQDLDFGDVPIGNPSMPNIKMLPYKITNNSSEDYYIEHMIVESNYPDSIGNYNKILFLPGIIYQYTTNSLLLKSNETKYLNVSYQSHLVDKISEAGEKLSITVSFFYRKASETILTEDSVKIYARSVPSNPMESFGFKYQFRFCPSGSKFVSDTYFVAVLNNTENDVKIDSMQISIDGENLTKKGLEDGDYKPVNFVKSNSFARYYFKFDFKKFEKTVARVKFFATSIYDKNKHYATEDSTIIEYIPSSEEGKISMIDRSFASFVGTISKRNLSVSSCAMSDFILDSVYIKQDPRIDEFYIKPSYDATFPIDIEQEKLTNISIEVQIAAAGSREARIYADFRRKSDDSAFTKYLDILVQGINPTSVSPEIEDSNPLKIFPNPARDNVSIMLDNSSELLITGMDIYDILGKRVYSLDSIFENTLIIQTTEFLNGNYICVARLNNGKIIQSNILISR